MFEPMDAQELADARAAMEESLVDTAQVLVYTKTSNGRGGEIVTYPPGPTYPARLAPYRPRPEQVQGDQLQSSAAFRLHLPHGAALTAKDRVQITGGDYGGAYEVETPLPRTTQLCLSAVVIKIGQQ